MAQLTQRFMIEDKNSNALTDSHGGAMLIGRRILRALGNPGLPLGFILSGALYYFAFLHYTHYEPTSYITGGFYGFLELWAATALMKKRKTRRFGIRIFDIIFVAFTLSILVSLGIHALPGKVKLLVFLSVFVIFPYFCARLLTIEEVEFLVCVIIAASAFAIPLVSLELVSEMRKISLHSIKYGLFGFSHTSLLAGLLFGSLICVIVGYLLRPTDKMLNGVLAKTGVFTLAFLLFLQTYLCARGGLIDAIVICMFLIVVSSWTKIWKRVSLLMFLGACIIIALQIVPLIQGTTFITKSLSLTISDLKKGHASFIKLRRSNDSIFVRSVLYHKAVEEFVQHPLTGVGAGRFGEVFGDVKMFPHSTLLQAFAELGAIGGLLLLSFIAWLISGLIKVFSASQHVEKKMLILLLGSLWGFYLISDQIYGDYFFNFSFCLLAGAIGSVIMNRGEDQRV